jgi:protein dithiol:quinone oxidoreductase
MRRPALVTMVSLCVAALAFALFAQYQWDMRPCAWCVLQRAIYALLAFSFALAAVLSRPRLRQGLLLLSTLLCGAGLASALFQHQVAAQQFSCKLSWADKAISSVGLDSFLPSVFAATANCSEAIAPLLGIPFALWSLALFAALGLGSIYALVSPSPD